MASTMIEQALRQLIITGVGPSIQNANGTYRFRPLKGQPNTEYPHIVYQRVSTERTLTHTSGTGPSRPRFQLSVYAMAYDDGRILCNQIIDLIHGFKGWIDGFFIQGAYNAGDTDGEIQESGAYQFNLDFFIWHGGI
jgi:hypothetical protein